MTCSRVQCNLLNSKICLISDIIWGSGGADTGSLRPLVTEIQESNLSKVIWIVKRLLKVYILLHFENDRAQSCT